MTESLSVQELADRTGESTEHLERWRSLGLIGSADSTEFTPLDVERVRLIHLFVHRGMDLDALAEWAKSGGMDIYLDVLGPQRPAPSYSLEEAARRTGLDVEVIGRMLEASGFEVELENLDDAALDTLRMAKIGLEIGYPVDAIAQLARVVADAMARIAEMETHVFHFYIRERLTAQGLFGPGLLDALRKVDERSTPLIEPLLLEAHRRAFRRAMREAMVLAVSVETGQAPHANVPGQLNVTVAFVDLSRFTPLAEAMGDLEAAQVLDRFSSLVRKAVSRCHGRLVKQIGDAFMMVFADARSAVTCALEIDQAASAEPQFPAVRAGLHCGPVLYREGDYVGANVIVASRLACEAEPHQVLLTEAVRREVGSPPGIQVLPVEKRRLKGLAEELEIFEAMPSVAEARHKVADPVCGMELRATEIAASLTLGGRQIAFCSEQCLRRFVAAPERYATL